jgi:hypothetical protein
VRIVNLAGVSVALQLVPAPVIYYRGFQLRETTGLAVALVRIWDAASATGTILDEISLAANESARENYSIAKTAKVGVYVEIVSGTVAGSICVD